MKAETHCLFKYRSHIIKFHKFFSADGTMQKTETLKIGSICLGVRFLCFSKGSMGFKRLLSPPSFDPRAVSSYRDLAWPRPFCIFQVG